MIILPNAGAIATSTEFLSSGLIHFRRSKMNTFDIIKVLSFASLTELLFIYNDLSFRFNWDNDNLMLQLQITRSDR